MNLRIISHAVGVAFPIIRQQDLFARFYFFTSSAPGFGSFLASITT